MEVDISAHMECFGNQLSQRSAIAIQGPAISADKREDSAVSEKAETPFDKSHVEIGPVVNRLVSCPILSLQSRRDLLDANVGRISDHGIELAFQRREQEIALPDPGLG